MIINNIVIMNLEEVFYYFKNNTITQCDNCKCMHKRSLLIETDACSTVHLYMGFCCKKLVYERRL